MNLLLGRRAFGPVAPPLDHGQRLDMDGLPLVLRVNPRTRRVFVRIDPRTGEAIASAPSARRLVEAVRFARSRRRWLLERLATRASAPRLVDGESIELFGDQYRLRADGRRPRAVQGLISGCGAGEVDPQLVARAVRTLALDFYRRRAHLHCDRLGAARPRVLAADAGTRWGSCTVNRAGEGSIRVSWRLALAPASVADYVVAHECAHLLEGNHGPRFWALVNSLVGDPAPSRAWLRREGPRLHAFGRTAASNA